MLDPDLKNCTGSAAEGHAIPPACYTSNNIAETEIGTVFRGGWIGIGRSDMVAKPGDFVALDIAYLKRMDASLEEDIEALENQHSGLSCPDAKQGRLQPDLEPNVAAFARWYSAVCS